VNELMSKIEIPNQTHDWLGLQLTYSWFFS